MLQAIVTTLLLVAILPLEVPPQKQKIILEVVNAGPYGIAFIIKEAPFSLLPLVDYQEGVDQELIFFENGVVSKAEVRAETTRAMRMVGQTRSPFAKRLGELHPRIEMISITSLGLIIIVDGTLDQAKLLADIKQAVKETVSDKYQDIEVEILE